MPVVSQSQDAVYVCVCFLRHPPLWFLSQGLLLIHLDWFARDPPISTSLGPSAHYITPGFLHGSWGLNTSPNACTGSMLSGKPSPKPGSHSFQIPFDKQAISSLNLTLFQGFTLCCLDFGVLEAGFYVAKAGLKLAV